MSPKQTPHALNGTDSLDDRFNGPLGGTPGLYGWRMYLSIILKAIHNKSERIKHLDNFFDEFRDSVLK